MKRKNVIFITIDELTYNVVNKELSNGVMVTPFLNELSKKSVVATKMYSQGPFTEVAVRGLLYGHDTLDFLENIFSRPTYDHAFFKYLKNEFRVETITNYLNQPKFENSTYSQIFKNDSWQTLLPYRFIDFEKDILNGNAKEYAYNACYEIIENMFVNFIALFNKCIDDDESVIYFKKSYSQSDEYYKDILDFYSKEYDKLKADRKKYIVSFFNEKKYIKFDEKDKLIKKQLMADEKLREYAIIEHTKYIKLLKKRNFWLNLKNSRVRFSEIKYNINMMRKGNFNQAKKNLCSLFKHYFQLLNEKYVCNYKTDEIIGDNAKMLGMFDCFFEFIERYNHELPYFCYMQPQDIHVPSDIFNVHAKDKVEIDKEMIIAKDFIRSVPSDFRGSLNYYTTARIMDEQLKNFFGKLEEKKLLDDTYVIITGDHGTSHSYDEIRDMMWYTSYDTQYHVPFIMFSKDINPQVIDKFIYSKDIPPTLFSMLDIEIPKHFTGNYIFNDNYQNKYIIHECMGTDCPNFHENPARFFIRDDTYKVSYWVMLNGDFKDGELKEINDLIKDPTETNNLIYSKYNKEKVKEMLTIIEERHSEIKKNSSIFL